MTKPQDIFKIYTSIALIKTTALLLLLGLPFSLLAQKKTLPPSPILFQNGRLTYAPDALGNRVVDFSSCGYHSSAQDIKSPPVMVVLEPGQQNDGKYIQAAIDRLAMMPLDKYGFRGTILLRPGIYRIQGSITIQASGIVLAGNKGTVLMTESIDRKPLINIIGGDDKQSGTEVSLQEAYLPVGECQFLVETASGFKVGDEVTIRRPSTLGWIRRLGTEHFGGGITALGWKPGERDIFFERKIIAINGNRVTIDLPLTTAIDSSYGGAYLSKYNWKGRIRHVGIENMELVSSYDTRNEKDEDHCWNAINMENLEDGWVRRIKFRNFAGSAVAVQAGARRVTVEDCISQHPVSEIGGQRRYTFTTSGQQTLFQRCYAEYGYHDFSVGFCAPGPNAFVQCHSNQPFAFSGAIDSWASGVLFDNVSVDGNALRFGDRGQDGNGAGWSAANSVFWQCSAAKIECDAPPTANNYAFGTWAQFSGNGYWENSNEHVNPRSLFYAQLKDRLGQDPAQRAMLLPVESEASSSPSVPVAAALTLRAKHPPLQLKDWIDSIQFLQPQQYDISPSLIKNINPVEALVHPKQPLVMRNGWLTINGILLTGKRQEVPWWNGGVSPKDLLNAKPHLTRYVPGRFGKGLTDNIEDVVHEMKSTHTAVLDHNYGLWYDRRRDDHQRVRRMDGEVWPPFYELPFSRSGKALAWDGLSKYDLTTYNRWYWNRLSQFAELADQQALVLIHQNYFQHNIIEAGAHFADFPWRTANNINNTGFPEPVPYAGDKRIFMDEQFYDISNGPRKQLHLAYINKCLDNFKSNNNVIQSIGAEYTGPLHFVEFWIDAIAAWKGKHRSNPLVALGTTKDVQDAILADKKRLATVDIIDIRYWHYQQDGKMYAPLGGEHLAPRQHARLLKPVRTSFEQVFRAVNEYRMEFEGKSVVYSGDAASQFGWAVLLAGGSLPVLPASTDSMFLKAVVNTLPVKGKMMLSGVKDMILYVDQASELSLDLTWLSGGSTIRFIDPQSGIVVGTMENVAGGKKTSIMPQAIPSIIWVSSK